MEHGMVGLVGARRKLGFVMLASWCLVALSIMLSGVALGDAGRAILGLVFLFITASHIAAFHVESDRPVKRLLEVLLLAAAFTVAVCGYAATGHVVLGAVTLFFTVLLLVAFILSWIAPRLTMCFKGKRWKPKKQVQ
ncbi:MAG: hypothetical protein QFX33_00485 [Candidatus Nezhaarchaeota archaeon]|nr:hypothetical protein [Candidatus Nezhaarchaeota archaeon]